MAYYSTITVCTVHVQSIRTSTLCATNLVPILVLYSYVQNTVQVYIETLSVNQWERRNNGILELYLSGCMQQKFHVMWFYWKYQYANLYPIALASNPPEMRTDA